MADFTINQGDTWPPLKATLQTRNETTGVWEALDLENPKANKVTMLATSTEPEALQIGGQCVLKENGKGGYVEYDWEAGDTSLAGIYRLQFQIEWVGGKIQTVPNANYYVLEIQPVG